MRRLFVAIGSCGLAFGIASASPPVPTSTGISALIEQLGSDRYSDREAAAVALEKLGPAAIEALKTATNSEIPEIRERAAALLTKLKRLSDSSTRLAAKRVKLDYTDMPLGTAVNDLRARTGLNITLDPDRVANPLRKITCRTAELPVWQALEEFCTAAGLREAFRIDLDVPKSTAPRRGYVPPPQPPGADGVPIVLLDGVPVHLPGDRSTALRVLALPAGFPGHKTTLGTGEVTLAFDVTPAPGLGWQDVTGVKIGKVIDSSGRSGGAGAEKNITPTSDPSGMVVFARPGVAMRFDINGNTIPPDSLSNPRVVTVPLKLGTSSAVSLRRLEGSIFGEIQVPNQPLITVENVKQNTGTRFTGPGDVKFTVLEVKDPPGPGGLGMVKVTMESPSLWAVNARRRGWNPGWPESPRMGQGNRVEAFDAAGKPMTLSTSSFSDISDDGLVSIQTYTMTFRAGQGTPTKLVVVGPKLMTVEVPFVMENVPLP
jgi:hypothetical protein